MTGYPPSTDAIAAANLHTRGWMSDGPQAAPGPQDNPEVRPVGPKIRPVQVRPKRPASRRGPPDCQCQYGGAQAISTPEKAARRSSQPESPVSVSHLAHGPSVPGHDRANRVSIGQYPRWLTSPQFPMPALWAVRPLWTSLPLMTKSAPTDVRVAQARFTPAFESLRTTPT